MGFTGSGFLLFEPRNSVFKSKIEARYVIESMGGRWDAKKTLGITGLHEILSRDYGCLLYTSPSPRDLSTSRMPSSA